MSVKRLTCPQCRTTLNVMANMASAKCPSCEHVFSTTETPKPAEPPAPKQTPKRQPAGGGNGVPWLIAGGLLTLAVGGLIGLTLLTRSGETTTSSTTEATKPKTETTSPAFTSPALPPVPTDYVKVDLSETRRREIYREYKQMMGRSIGKSEEIPNGTAGQAFKGMLGNTMKREITRLSLWYGITEEEYMHIVGEGQAKEW
ncbi:MAG: hypothetical protein AAFV88_22950 [Planctomycetota bacterium]